MLSERVLSMVPSVTVELTAKVIELKKRGVDVIGLNVGEPDFNTPDNICHAAIDAIRNGFSKYTPVSGIAELRNEICQKFKKDNQLDYKPEEVVVSTGAKQAIANAILALCNPGDEVILPIPCWMTYPELIKLAGSKPVYVETDEQEGFQLNLENIKNVITKKTKAIILNTPNNPTGAVFSRQVLEGLAQLAIAHNIYVIADEVYEKLIFDGAEHVSIAALSPEIKELTITVNGFSKAYAMTGWRLGYAAGPEKIIKGMSSLQGHLTHCPNSITQKAAVEALAGPQDAIEMMREKFDERRKYLVARLKNMPGITCTNALGAFYLMPNVSSYYGKTFKGAVIKDSVDFSKFLLEEAHIAVVPGLAFEAPDLIRISYSASMENLQTAMDRMEKVLWLIS